MEQIRSTIIKGSKDRKGRTRKFIPVPKEFYTDFEFGEIVRIEKLQKNESAQES